MKVYITGNQRGLGKYLHNYFLSLNYQVIGLGKNTGYNLEKDIDQIISQIEYESLFINNAYANNSQIKYLTGLHNKVEKMIVCGSIASEFPDISMPKYSINKKKLRKKVLELSHVKSQTDYLILHLTSSSYYNFDLIRNSIEFWLKNPQVIEIGYKIDLKTTLNYDIT